MQAFFHGRVMTAQFKNPLIPVELPWWNGKPMCIRCNFIFFFIFFLLNGIFFGTILSHKNVIIYFYSPSHLNVTLTFCMTKCVWTLPLIIISLEPVVQPWSQQGTDLRWHFLSLGVFKIALFLTCFIMILSAIHKYYVR